MKRLLQLSILFITILFISSCGSDSGGPNPEITSVQPESGPPGTSVTIAGKGFRPHGEMNVTFGGSSATLISATEDQIQTEVPDGLSEGSAPVEVSVEGETASGPSFMVEAKAPGISSVEPDSGTVGTEVTIKGMNFSATASENSISFDGTSAQVKGAAQDQLITEVPQGATDGPIEVTVKQKSTTGPDFDVITDGVLEVHTNTTGDDQDSDRYDMFIDGTDVASIANSGIATFPEIEQGSHDLELSDIASNCSVQGQNPRSVTISAGDTTSTTFDVSCQTVADGKIAFTSDRDGDVEVFMMNTDGSSPTKLTNNTAGDISGPISPNGTKIAFVSDRSGSAAHLYVMDADGSNVQQLTSSGAQVIPTGSMSWSPDGSTLVFVDDRSGNDEIYSIGADGSGEQRLTNNSAADTHPHWSPDGSKIVYSSETDGDSEIYTMNPDGTGRQKLTDDTDYNGTARWAPDGSKIAFASDRSGNTNLHIMNADGTGVQQVTSTTAEDGFPSWSPDGSELSFYSMRSGNAEVYKINADGSGTPINLTAHSAVDYIPYWSPVE